MKNEMQTISPFAVPLTLTLSRRERGRISLRALPARPMREGFTLLEVLVASGLLALLAAVLSTTWSSVGHTTSDVIARSRVAQEMDLAVNSLARDLGGSLADGAGRLGGKKQSALVGWMTPGSSQLWLCFDSPANPDGVAEWGPPDTVIVYMLMGNRLVRWNQTAATAFTVAGNVDGFGLSILGNQLQIDLTFTYRTVTQTCTLMANTP